MRLVRVGSLALVLLLGRVAFAEVVFHVPIVTQLQGVTFYRTSLSIANVGEPTRAALTFFYRSPDGSFQNALAITSTIARDGVFATDDVIDYLKSVGAIRAADQSAALFGSLEVQFFDVTINDPGNYSIVARTYSPGPGNAGTMGIAYAGRAIEREHGSFSGLIAPLRNGVFGRDGNSRVNIAFLNMANGAQDVKIFYIDPATGATLKSFLLSSVAGHELERREVVQLNNIFADPALSGVSRITLIATPTEATISGYVVQLDNTTNDGSFFLMAEQ